MKVRCKSEVQDKYTGEDYKVNQVYDFSEERAAEVVKAHNGRYFEYIEEEVEENKTIEKVVEEKPKKTTKKSVKKSTKK